MPSRLVSMPALRRRLVKLTAVWNGAIPWSETTKTLASDPAASAILSTARRRGGDAVRGEFRVGDLGGVHVPRHVDLRNNRHVALQGVRNYSSDDLLRVEATV